MEVMQKISWPYWLQKAWPFLAFAGAFFIVVGVVTFLFWYTLNRPNQSPPAFKVEAERELTPEERLKSISAPPDAEPLSAEKLEEIIQNTTAPDAGNIAPAEEERLIDNTSAPTP